MKLISRRTPQQQETSYKSAEENAAIANASDHIKKGMLF